MGKENPSCDVKRNSLPNFLVLKIIRWRGGPGKFPSHPHVTLWPSCFRSKLHVLITLDISECQRSVSTELILQLLLHEDHTFSSSSENLWRALGSSMVLQMEHSQGGWGAPARSEHLCVAYASAAVIWSSSTETIRIQTDFYLHPSTGFVCFLIQLAKSRSCSSQPVHWRVNGDHDVSGWCCTSCV